MKHSGNTARSSGTTHVKRSLARKAQGMDLCQHRQAGNKERKTVLNNSRTRAAKAKAQEEYKAVKRSIKDKRDYIDDLARQRQQPDRVI